MTDEEIKTGDDMAVNLYRIRVSEWSEWMPVFADAATEGQLMFPNWHTFLEADVREKLTDIQSVNTGQVVERWVVSSGEGEDERQSVLVEGVEPEQEAIDSGRAIKTKFVLYHFTATLASLIENAEEPPEPMLTSKVPPRKPDAASRLAIPSGALPGGMPNKAEGKRR